MSDFAFDRTLTFCTERIHSGACCTGATLRRHAANWWQVNAPLSNMSALSDD